MIDRRRITSFVDAIVKRFAPDRVVLFGSYADGQANEDSDVDLLVIMNHEGAGAEQAARIRQTIRSGFPMDLIVRSPSVIQQRLKIGDSFIRDILERGQVLHDAARS